MSNNILSQALNIMMKKIILLFSLPFCFANPSNGQVQFTDTISVLSYNINNYGTSSSVSCPLQGSPKQDSYLRNILNYLNAPDIVALEKFSGSPTNLASFHIQKYIMDSVCGGCYANTNFTNVSGYKKVNTLFYKTSKFGYLGTTSIYTADNSISDINLHKLYYKSPSLATFHDTTFLNVIVVHDASGSSSAAQRGTEIQGAMNWLSTHSSQPGNYIFMGDFNTQGASESCVQAMINPIDTTFRFYEPTNLLGEWSRNAGTYAKYLTQSTRRVDPGDCASTNTISSWFDHIFCSNSIMKGSKKVYYIPGSFNVVGQDGLHTGLAINDAPTNNSVPPTVLNSLYMMSEHLPVLAKLLIGNTNPLPIGFDYFRINSQNKMVSLQWQTNNNENALVYEIEQSENGKDFSLVLSVTAKNGNTVVYTIPQTTFSNNNSTYYRIKQVLKNGSCLYSNVEALQPSNIGNSIIVSPNPVVDFLNLSFNSEYTTTATIQLLNTQGKIIMNKNLHASAGLNAYHLTNIVGLVRGLYVVKLITNEGIQSKIFIKE